MYRFKLFVFKGLILVFILNSCTEKSELKIKKYNVMEVKASAYNSVSYQTDGNPRRAAWGDILQDSMKVIAVSRDLIDSGLVNNTKVYIPALKDTFIVKDKMHYRWRNKIDVYFGRNIQAAKEFGRKKLVIVWE